MVLYYFPYGCFGAKEGKCKKPIVPVCFLPSSYALFWYEMEPSIYDFGTISLPLPGGSWQLNEKTSVAGSDYEKLKDVLVGLREQIVE